MAEKKTAILTGAGSGIGRSAVLLLADHGWRITLVGRTPSRLEETRDLVAARVEGCDAEADLLVVPADVSDPAAAGDIVGKTTDRWGRVDGLVNNAAIAAMRPVEQADRGLLEEIFAINVFGPFYLVGAAWPVLVKQGEGRVVNVSSVATADPFPGLAAYAATKSAVESLTRSIMVEGVDHGIRAFSIGYAAVETDMLRQVVTKDELPEDQAIAPAQAAQAIVDCLSGRRDGEAGKVIV